MTQEANSTAPAAAPFSAFFSGQELVATAPRPRASWCVLILTTLGVMAALYFGRDMIMPLVLAVLLALLLRPLQRRMKRLRVPNAVSALVLMTAVVIVFAVGVLTLARQAQQWLSEACCFSWAR